MALGGIGAAAGALGGVGVMSGVGATMGGSAGFFVGQAIEGPKRKEQVELHKHIEVSFIERDKAVNNRKGSIFQKIIKKK